MFGAADLDIEHFKKIDLKYETTLKVLAICQDMISLGNHGAMTPKNVAIGNFVRHTSANSQLVGVLNRFGHSICHSTLIEQETAMAEAQLNKKEGIPDEFEEGAFTTVVFDNNDFNEKTLSG